MNSLDSNSSLYISDSNSKTERNAKAVESHRKCLKLNPFMWSAFEALCHLGK